MHRTALADADRQRFTRARERGHHYAMRPTAVVTVRYDATRGVLELTLRDGKVRSVPRRLLPELDGVPDAVVRSVTVSPAGDAISWRELDVDVSVQEMLERERRVHRVDFDGRGGQTT